MANALNAPARAKKRKTVIAPKTILLLRIALHGVGNTTDYLARLSGKIERAR
jgi:hypothetical protein